MLSAKRHPNVAFLFVLCIWLFLYAAWPTGQVKHPLFESVAKFTILFSTGGEGSCTAFSINEREGYWITAEHCIKPMSRYRIRGQWAEPIMADERWDVAVVKGPKGVKPMTLAREWPLHGHAVLFPVYIAKNREPWLLFGLVSSPVSRGVTSLWDANLTIHGAVYRGASGGPILNGHERVVSIVQGGYRNASPPMTFGIPYHKLREYTEPFWQCANQRSGRRTVC